MGSRHPDEELHDYHDEPEETGRGSHRVASPDSGELPLLPAEELTIERLATWIATYDKLDGLAWPIAKPAQVPLQEQVQVVTSLVEGLHRRLPFQQTRILGTDKTATRRIREAAVAAAVEHARKEADIDPAVVEELVRNAMNHVGDVSFNDRATAIVTQVSGAVPEFTTAVPNLVFHIKKARNDFAHHLQYKEQNQPLAVRYVRWTLIATITPWLLRALLLLHAGFDATTIRDGYLASERFTNHMEEVNRMATELGWQT